MYSNMIVSYAALHKLDSAQVYFAHYNATSDSSWYLKAGTVKTKDLTEEANILGQDPLRFYFIYALLLMAVSAITWFVARKKYSR